MNTFIIMLQTDVMNDRYCNTEGIEAPPVNLETTVFEGILIMFCMIKNQKYNLPLNHNISGSNLFFFQRIHPFPPIHFEEFPGPRLQLLASSIGRMKLPWIAVKRQHHSLVTGLLQQQISGQPTGRQPCLHRYISPMLCVQLDNITINLIIRQLNDQYRFQWLRIQLYTRARKYSYHAKMGR